MAIIPYRFAKSVKNSIAGFVKIGLILDIGVLF